MTLQSAYAHACRLGHFCSLGSNLPTTHAQGIVEKGQNLGSLYFLVSDLAHPHCVLCPLPHRFVRQS